MSRVWLRLVSILLLSFMAVSCRRPIMVFPFCAYVWADLNGNGVQDPDEEPVPMVFIQVVNPSGRRQWEQGVTSRKGVFCTLETMAPCHADQRDVYLIVPAGYLPTTPVVVRTESCDYAQFGLRPE